MFGLLCRGTASDDVADRLDGFRPENAAARNAGLGAGVVDDAALQVHHGRREGGTVGISEPAVDAKQDHRLELRAGRVHQAKDFICGEQLGALPGPLQAHGLFARPLEPGAEPHGPVNQVGIEGELEDAAHELNGLAEPVRSPLLGQLVPQLGEVVRVDVRHAPQFSERCHDRVGRVFVIRPGPRRQLAGVHQGLLRGEELVAQLLDGDPLRLGPRLAARV